MGVGSKISGGEKKGTERGQLEGLHSPPVSGVCSTARGGRSDFAQALPCRKTKTACFWCRSSPMSSPQHSQQQRPGAAVTAGSWGSVPRAAGKPQGARGCEALGKKTEVQQEKAAKPPAGAKSSV